jgi:hypothetical protein
MQWTPKAGKTVLDELDRGKWPSFEYVLLRNGHAVGFFVTKHATAAKADERRSALPADVWTVAQR